MYDHPVTRTGPAFGTKETKELEGPRWPADNPFFANQSPCAEARPGGSRLKVLPLEWFYGGRDRSRQNLNFAKAFQPAPP